MTRAIRYIPLSSKVRAPAYWPRAFSGLMVYILLLALVTGFGSAIWILRGSSPLGREQAGAWTYWPDIGSPHADPYARAIISRQARLPFAVGEGVELVAERDGSGEKLRSDCTYRIGETMPQARFWTIAAFGSRNGRTISTALERKGFTSSEIVRDEAGRFSILLSRLPQSGNWLQLPERTPFVLVLRLYDTPSSGGRAAIEPAFVPQIERLECGP